jgi:hypothetical protein
MDMCIREQAYQKSEFSHGMRNELSFSSEEALDGSSGHVCCLDEEAYPRVLQASDNLIKGVL